MTDFVISDTHFYHTNIIRYCDRPFANAEEMDETIIANWNRVVRPTDRVYHLGDFAYGRGSVERIPYYRGRLNGEIVLFKGNHDHQTTNWYIRAGFKAVWGGEFILYRDRVMLSHRPSPTKAPMMNIHGHTHNLMCIKSGGVYANVSVEAINYTPVVLEDLIARMKNDQIAVSFPRPEES